MLAHTLPNFGITATFVNIHNLSEVEVAIQDNTRAIYIETLGNPNSDIPDIDALAELAHKRGLPLLLTTPSVLRILSVLSNTVQILWYILPQSLSADTEQLLAV